MTFEGLVCGQGDGELSQADVLAMRRFSKFLRLAGPSVDPSFPLELLDEKVDDEPDAPTWREWIGAL